MTARLCKLLEPVEKYLVLFESTIAASSLLLLLALSLVQVIARNFFETGFSSFEIINRHLLLYVVFMGAAVATQRRAHIKIDAFNTLISEHTQARLARPLSIFAAILCFAFVRHAWQFCVNEWQYAPANERWIVPFIIIYPTGFLLFAIHFIIQSIKPVSTNHGKP